MTVEIPQSEATLALDYLHTTLADECALRLDPAPSVVFGWREAPKQVNQGVLGANRVVVSPGDPTGKMGDFMSAKLPGRAPRPLATMGELVTLYLWAFDGSDPTDAKAQWAAARRLHDVVFGVLIRTFQGRFKQVSKQWLNVDRERAFGAEIEAVIMVEAMIPDDMPVLDDGSGITFNPTIAANGGTPVPC